MLTANLYASLVEVVSSLPASSSGHHKGPASPRGLGFNVGNIGGYRDTWGCTAGREKNIETTILSRVRCSRSGKDDGTTIKYRVQDLGLRVQ